MEENKDLEQEVQEELDNIIVLNDENGNEVEFEFLDFIELNGNEYVVLIPVLHEGEDEDVETEVLILQVEVNGEEESYVNIEDEVVLNQVFSLFKEKYSDFFDFVDGE
jgi:Protein of unknown function (DUF1292).